MFSGCDSLAEFSGKFASEDGHCLVVDSTLILFAKMCDAKEFTIPQDIINIGDYAFNKCKNLQKVTIAESVTNIGELAFDNCSNVSLFTFKSATPPTIGSNIFGGIENLAISIPIEAVEAYLTCDWPYEYRRAIIELADINNIPDSCRLYYTTYDNQKLNVYPEDGYRVLSHTYTDGQGVVVFFEPLNTIGDWAFSYCESLTSINIPDGVTTMGDGAFYDCTSLTSINIPDGVTTIGNGAFSGCVLLEEIAIPDSVRTIEYNAFFRCTSLTSVTIPDSVTTIGDYAFEYCI